MRNLYKFFKKLFSFYLNASLNYFLFFYLNKKFYYKLIVKLKLKQKFDNK